MISDIRDFRDRRAPYAPISSLERFFERIRNLSVPEHVDQAYLQRLGVASNNEYALLSALKFLGIVDDRGRPTAAYHGLQSADGFQRALSGLVRSAYGQLFEMNAQGWSAEELTDWFRMNSSPSQARNAARFFQAVCRLAGMRAEARAASGPAPAESLPRFPQPEDHVARDGSESLATGSENAPGTESRPDVLLLKARILEKLPAARADWSAAEYRAICDRFVDMLRALDLT